MIEYEEVMVVVEVVVEVRPLGQKIPYREDVGAGSRFSAGVPDFFGISKEISNSFI